MEHSEFLATVERMHADARHRGLFFQSLDAHEVRTRHVQLAGRETLAFASCSYLGLEFHPQLIAAAHEALDRYGTQFSASRGYLALPENGQLEAALDQIFEGYCLVATSTTLAHQIALPVLACERDAIVMDHQVHHSVQIAATLARAAGAHVECIRHGNIYEALGRVSQLARKHRRVWFCCDGVFSMFGDLAPISLLEQLLETADNVFLYVDDAHGMSWAGKHGRGSFRSRMRPHPRVVVATSLNKAFSAAGGCVVLPTPELREQIRLCAGPMVFSGPLQPPMLAAALASAKVHLSPEITRLQRELSMRVDHCNKRAHELELPLLVTNDSPILFFRCGLPRVALTVAERLRDRGIFITPSIYPAVPMRTAGIRLSLTCIHTIDDIDRVLAALSEEIPAVLERERISREALDDLFADAILPTTYQTASELRRLTDGHFNVPVARPHPTRSQQLSVRVEETIHNIDRELWDRHMATLSCSSWSALAVVEGVFRNQPAPEHNWTFFYVIVTDPQGRVVALTYFTLMLSKDDMLMRSAVSSAIERRRGDDPYFLTSRVVCMGSGFSEGVHLYLDRDGPWEAGLDAVLEVARARYQQAEAGMMMLRDFPRDPQLAKALLDRGFVEVPMLDSHQLEISWQTPAEFLARLSRRRRRRMRKIVAQASNYTIRVVTSADEQTVEELYSLYRNVANRKLRLNMFPLPRNLVAGLVTSPAWELVTLHLSPDAGGPGDSRPVAWFAAHLGDDHYAPLVCGLDYTYVYAHGAYRQMLYQVVMRAQARGAGHVHLGMDADLEKDRFGTERISTCAFVQTRDDFIGAQIREIVAEVGLSSS